MKKVLLLACICIISVSCDVAKNIAGIYNLTQCEYKYNSISGLTLAGINVQNVTGASSLNPLTLTSLIAAFGKSSIPLSFILNLDVKNPNYQPAILNGLQYVLEIDNIQMTSGSVNSRMQVATGEIAQLPINISFDLKKALSKESGEAMKNMAFNFVGLGDKPTSVTILLKPTLDIGGQALASPVYIPVTFTYGKNK
jgi:LEA14-like dessication related protein